MSSENSLKQWVTANEAEELVKSVETMDLEINCDEEEKDDDY